MTDSRVVYLGSRAAAAAPAADTPRVLAAFAHALERIPSCPGGFSACVAHLQEEHSKLAVQMAALRALQRFRDALFHAPGREVEMRQLWRESLTAACYARLLAAELAGDAPLLTGAALLHRLGDVLALRALAHAEFNSGQRLGGPVLQEVTAAQNGPLATRAITQWSLSDSLRSLLAKWRSDDVWTGDEPAARHLALVQLLAFEHVHAGRSTPGVVETAFDQAQLPLSLLDLLRGAQPSIDALLLRVAPRMGTIALVQ
ncbi:MAG: HDOD domain-containing protein [Steroidobacteraceae bacterium]